MPSSGNTVRQDLLVSVACLDVEKVREIVEVPWERIKRRRVGGLTERSGDTRSVRDSLFLKTAVDVAGAAHSGTEKMKSDSEEILKLLIDNGASRVFKDKDGDLNCVGYVMYAQTPYPRVLDVLRVFLDSGWDLTVGDQAPLAQSVARRAPHVDVLQMLIDHGLPRIGLIPIMCGCSDPFWKNDISVDFVTTYVNHAKQEWLGSFLLDRIANELLALGARPEIAQCIRDWCANKVKFNAITLPLNLPVPDPFKDKECSVCYEKFAAGQKVITLRCGHSFCFDCMITVAESKDHRCPYCRQDYR